MENEQFTGLLRAFAEGLRPHLGLDDFNPNDIDGLITEAIDNLDLYDAISDAIGMNSAIPSIDEMNTAIGDSIDEADFIRPEDFDPSDYDVVTFEDLHHSDAVVTPDDLEASVIDVLDHVLTTEFIIDKLIGDGYEVVAKAEAA